MKILNNKGEEISKLDLGIVEAGKSKEYSYFLLNDSAPEIIDIKIEISNKEVTILNSPKKLNYNEKSSLKIRWSPSLTIKRGLQTLIKITGTELYK